MRAWFKTLRQHAARMEQEVHALGLAYRDPRTPWYAKAWAGLVVSYLFSPIDLVPDFIPLLGYLDDLVLVPLGIWLALRMIPAEVMEECRAAAQEAAETARPTSRLGLVVITLVWVVALVCVAVLILR